MPEIKPFHALTYDPRRVQFAQAVAPPYDVIQPERRKQLYDLSPYNVIRLILGRERDPYSSAAGLFTQWKGEGIISRAAEPAFYILSQRFETAEGTTLERRGFVAACRLEEFGRGSVYPHEQTHHGPKADRLRLFEATHAMFSQIFSLYADPKHVLDRHLDLQTGGTPDVEVDFDRVRNRMWIVRDTETILALSGFLHGQRVLVADGHHRYETALAYANARRLNNPAHTGTEPYNFVPMYFTNMNDPGLVILPTHRVVHSLPGFSRENLLEKLETSFELEFEESLEDLVESLAERKEGAFGLILGGSPGFVFLSHKGGAVAGTGDTPALLARLDVTVLHSQILERILGITAEDQAKKLHLEYEQDATRAVRTVLQGKAQAAFLLNPTRIEQLRAISEAGFTMPQKSTYFSPKLLSGLLIYSFVDG